jgi:hypothetical protein
VATNSNVILGGTRMRVNPHDIRWNFKMKMNDAKSLGGKVVQITGMQVSDITVKGKFTPDRQAGDTEAWQQQMRFRAWLEKTTESTRQGRKPIRFAYPTRGWDFNVFVKAVVSPTVLSVDSIAPEWEIALFPFDETSTEVVKGVKDLYIRRLMEGVGWKQTDYNGPTQQEVDDLLSPFGGSPQDYIESQYEEAAYGQALAQPGSTVTPGVTYGGIQQ